MNRLETLWQGLKVVAGAAVMVPVIVGLYAIEKLKALTP